MSDKGQITWKRAENGELDLYLRVDENSQWKPYIYFKIPDYKQSLSSLSKGMATFHHYFKLGWEVVKSDI